MRRALLGRRALLLLAGCAGATAGCGSSGHHPAVSTSPPVILSSTAATSPAATAVSTQPSNVAPPTPTGSAVCTTSLLSVTLGTGNGAAGSTYYPLRFTNHASAPCTLDGYPGVSYVSGANGSQVGQAATRDQSGVVGVVTLLPGRVATATLRVTDYQNFDPATCQAKPVAGLRVYPPGDTGSEFLSVASGSMSCSGSPNVLSVTAVAAAAGNG